MIINILLLCKYLLNLFTSLQPTIINLDKTTIIIIIIIICLGYCN